jgi:hypothetical protein
VGLARCVALFMVLLLATGAAPRGADMPAGPATRRAVQLRVQLLRLVVAVKAALFREQRLALDDPSRFKCVWTTRRAGKTTAALCDWICAALLHPHSASIYIGITFSSAERIAWPILKDLDRQFHLGMRFQEAKLKVTLPNGATLQLLGADRPGFAKRLLGQKLLRVYIDEAAFYQMDLAEFIKSVIVDALSDLRGALWLMSTPGVIPAGLFFELTAQFAPEVISAGLQPERTDELPDASRWRVHTWTTFENPYMAAQFAEEIEAEIKANPKVESTPEFLRNKRKAWVFLSGERVYHVKYPRNAFHGEWRRQAGDHYLLTLDFGWKDRTAVGLDVYRDDSPLFVELWCRVLEHPTMQQLSEVVLPVLREYGDNGAGDLFMLGDPGSKMYFEEFKYQYNLPMAPAEKSHKNDWIDIANDQILRGACQWVDPPNSPTCKEMAKLTWTWKKSTGEKEETRGQFNDCCDRWLYAFRHARHYLRGEEEPSGPPTAAEQARAIEERMVEAEIEAMEASNGWNDI